MSKIEIQLTKPTLELRVVGHTADKRNTTIHVGFRRYKRSEVKMILQLIQALEKPDTFRDLLSQVKDSPAFEKYHEHMNEEDFIKHAILYMSNLSLSVDGESVSIDTRHNLLPDTDLDFFINLYCEDTAFFVPLQEAFLQSMVSTDLKAEALKN